MDDDSKPNAEPLFRASKRRKIYRQRPEEEEPHTASALYETTETGPNTAPLGRRASLSEDEGEQGGVSVQALRRRLLQKSRRGGMGFTNAAPTPTTPQPLDTSIATDPDRSVIEIAQSRFAPETGKVAGDQDKHL